MPFAAINDPKKVGIDITDKGHWGNGDVRIKLKSLDQIDYAMFLIKQSFDYQKENGD
jgi:predicted transport protein